MPIYLRVAPHQITYICKIMEGYEYLGVVTTLNRTDGIIVIRATPDTYSEVKEILANLPIPFEYVDKAGSLSERN